MFNVTYHKGNTNQNHNEILPYTCQQGYYQKKQQITSISDVEKKEILCNVLEM